MVLAVLAKALGLLRRGLAPEAIIKQILNEDTDRCPIGRRDNLLCGPSGLRVQIAISCSRAFVAI